MKNRITGLLTLALSLAFAVPGAAQEPKSSESERRERTLARTRQLLEQRPTHAALFDRYFKLLVSGNEVNAEVAALRARLEADPGEQSTSIVLGRLLLRAGKEDEALHVLDEIEDKSSDIQAVLGDIYSKLARHDSAVRAFEAALPSAKTAEQKRVLYEKKGRAQLALGDKAAAVATWGAIGELDGGKFHRRLRVAELLVEAGLLDEASAAYQPLLTESEGDPAQHCRVLRDRGRLEELQGHLDGALATYAQIIELTARGNWLRKEVEQRVVQVYRRTGRLEELVAHLREQTAEHPDDLGAHELLADVLIEMRELAHATAVLAAVAPRFPRDVRLSRRVADLHTERGDVSAAIAEYQRILGERPEQLELYLELGTLFAEHERLEEAKNQWEKALARRLEDASLCTRIAAMYALWNRHDDAVRLYERAVELEPEAMVRYTDLAEFQFARGQRDQAEATLGRALEVASGKPRRLEVLAGSFREHDFPAKARTCLEQILVHEPENQEVRYALADLLVDAREVEPARALLWQVIESESSASGYRTMAANMLVFLSSMAETRETLIAEAERRDSAGAAFVAGRAHSRSRDFDRAIAAYRLALQRKPDDVEARRMLARLLAEEGDFGGALDEYGQLALIAPGERRRQFREVARLHLEMYELDQAMEVWSRAMRDHPDVPAVFLEVGRELMEIQRVHEALDALRQAARLKSRDPDIQLRLAVALRAAGKVDEAEAELLAVATEALDARDRGQARAELFELYAEQGAIDKRIEALQSTVAENPYDAQAPQLLADLYMRTGDYVLGLEMVEDAIKFQPRNRELMSRQAELLEELEEWERAHAVHAELLKFPDAERDVHLAGMGRALYEMGRAEEAKDVFKSIRDRGRVSELYEEYQLYDEAIDYYRRAIARNPGELRSYVLLAEKLVERNRHDEAITTLEKVLNLRPYYRHALQLAGKLYVQNGRRDDAVQVGMRLFGLRGEEVRKTRREEYEEEEKKRRDRYRRYAGGGSSSFGQQRLQTAQSYFDERGLSAEWGGILVAEAKRRPADMTLLEAVRGHYSWRDKSAVKHAAFLTELLQADLESVRVPPGFTLRSYRQMLEGRLIDIWQQDVSVAEDRIAVLAGASDPHALLERAVLHRSVGKLADMEGDLQAVLRIESDNAIARAMLTELCLEENRFDQAREHLGALAEWWSGPGEQWRDELDQRALANFAKVRKGMLDELPRRVRRRVENEDLLAVLRDTRLQSFDKIKCFSFPESVAAAAAIQSKLIRVCRAARDDDAAARAARAALEMADTLAERSSLGVILQQERLSDLAEACLLQVLERGEELQADPLQVYFWSRYYQRWVSSAADPLAQIRAARGEILDAYHVLRENGHGEQAELLIRKHDKVDELAGALRTFVDRAASALETARSDSSDEIRSIELDYRDAVIKLADFLMAEKDFAAAEEVYEQSAGLLPDDLDIRQVIAQLRLRRGDADGAVDEHHEMIALKRRLRRMRAGDVAVPPTRMTPTVPGQSASSSVTRSSPRGYYVPWYMRQQKYDVTTDYLAILKIYQQHNDNQGILDTLRRIMREDPVAFRTLAWEVLNQIRNQDLGVKKLPILRILKGVASSDEWLSIQYCVACREEGELAEAKRSLEKILGRTRDDQAWYVEQAERELEKVRQKLGEPALTAADLRAKVEKEPDNVRHRLRLADRLEKDHEYAACLAEAQVIVEKAPYVKRAKQMVVEMAAASGADDVAVAMLRRLREEATESGDRMRQGVHLADWLYASGDRDEAFGIIGGLETESGGTNQFSPGNWFLDRYQIDRAVEHFTAELAKQKTQPWYADQIRNRLMRVELAAGRVVEAVERSHAMVEEAGSLADREQKFKAMLGFLRGHPRPGELYAALETEFGARSTTKERLIMAAATFVAGDIEAAERQYAAAAAASSKEVYLFPLLLGMRRLRGDGEGALEVLDRMSRTYGGSDTMQWSSGVSLSMRDRIKVERAMILNGMDRAGESDALIESLADETNPGSMLTVAKVYDTLQRWEESLEWRRRYLEKKGSRDKTDLLTEAGLLVKLDRIDEALAPAREAYTMSRGASDARSLLTDLYRRAGRLEEFVAELEAEYRSDPRNDSVRSSLLSLYAELDLHDERRAVYETMLEQPDQRASALQSLFAMEQDNGDREAALARLRQLIELKGGDEKKEQQKKAATLVGEIGDWEAAETAYAEAVDMETAAGIGDLARWLLSNDREPRAAAHFARALELDPDDDGPRWPLARFAWREGRADEALQHAFTYFRERRGRQEIDDEWRTVLLDCLAGLTPERREQVLARGDEVEGAELAALLSWVSARPDVAEQRASEALQLDPDSIIALDIRARVLRETDRHDERAAAVEALRRRWEREYVTSSDWTYRGKAQSLQDELGRIALQTGDPARASALWKEQPIRREPYSNAFNSWRSDWNVRYTAEHWLAAGRPADALQALETEFLLRESPPWELYLEALEKSGQEAVAEAVAWRRLIDPLDAYGARSGSSYYFFSTGNQQARPEVQRIARLYRDRHQLAELEQRAEKMRQEPATVQAGEQLLREIASLRRDDAFLARLSEQKLVEEKKEEDDEARYQVALSWLRAGQPDRALEHMKKFLDFEDETLERAHRPRSGSRYTRYSGGMPPPSATNPFSMTLGGGNTFYSWSSRRRSNLTAFRQTAAALLFLTGDRDRALAVENDILDDGKPQDRDARKQGCARAYLKHVPAEAVRLLREVLDATQKEIEDEECAGLLSQLAAALREAGDIDGRRAVLEERKRTLEKLIADAPGPHAISHRRALVDLLVHDLERPDEGLAALQPLLASRTSAQDHQRVLGEIWLQKGDASKAVQFFRELRDRRVEDGHGRMADAELDARLGLALLAAGEEEEGRRLLWEAMPGLSRDGRLDRKVREAMGL